jgi:uncharacterized membrane protein
LLLRLGDFVLNIGLSKGLTPIVAPIAGAYPTLFVTLSFIIFKDKVTKSQMFGILITLVGIISLSFFN